MARSFIPARGFRAVRRAQAAALVLIPAALTFSLALATPLWAGETAGQTPDTCVCPEHVTLAQPAWIRLPPPNAPVTAAYMTLVNEGDHDLTVVAAESPIAGTVELHEHLQDATGVMRMRQVASMPLPAGGTLTMEPGGLHVMLIDLLRPLAEGDAVSVTLRFADGQSLEAAAEVRRMAPGQAHGHQHH